MEEISGFRRKARRWRVFLVYGRLQTCKLCVGGPVLVDSGAVKRNEKGFFSDGFFYGKLFRTALPITLQALLVSLVAACDAFMLGRVDQDSMAAVSLASQIQFLQNMGVATVTAALSLLGAQYWGKGDRETLGRLFRLGLRNVGFVSAVFAGLCLFCPRALMRIFAGDPALVSIGAGYLRIAGISYLFVGVSQCYLTILKVTDRAALSAKIAGGAVLLNIALNAVFIYGLGPAPAMGARGAALATLLARFAELGAAVLSGRAPGAVRPEWRRLLERMDALAGDFRRAALPLVGGVVFWGCGFASYTAVMGHLGPDTAAANAAAAVVRDLLCCLTDGLAAAAVVVVGNELGAGRLVRGRLYGNRIGLLSIAVGALVALLVLAAAPLVLRVMELTPEARALLRSMFFVLSLYMVGRCINTMVINGVFTAGGDTLFDFYSLAVCMWCLAVPLAFLGAFVFHWHPVLVYACTCVDEVGKLPWVYLHFRRYKWVRNLTR